MFVGRRLGAGGARLTQTPSGPRPNTIIHSASPNSSQARSSSSCLSCSRAAHEEAAPERLYGGIDQKVYVSLLPACQRRRDSSGGLPREFRFREIVPSSTEAGEVARRTCPRTVGRHGELEDVGVVQADGSEQISRFEITVVEVDGELNLRLPATLLAGFSSRAKCKPKDVVRARSEGRPEYENGTRSCGIGIDSIVRG